ncbi:uncharacterized protein [Onthophagus taurus]|uniref:uncharacterized protein n=1 Tax=Onthophagus taurus TaxID=166361 RepID=UPI0039BDC177
MILKLFLLFQLLKIINTAFPPILRSLPPISNKIISTTTSCDSKRLNVTVVTEQGFKGMLLAKEFSQDCRSSGNSSNSLTLSLPTTGCGVKLKVKDNDQVIYSVTVVLQQDKFLRQISDQEARITCKVNNGEESLIMEWNAKMEDALKKEVQGRKVNNRKGRMRHQDLSEILEEELISGKNDKLLSEALNAARAWMEIVPENDVTSESLKVGEPALLVIKSTLPAGIGWKVVDCIAHDGIGDSYQKLLDDFGCPIDELLLPELSLKPPRPIALMKHQEAIAKFAAFKFPDRNRLHFSCSLQLCRSNCSQIHCDNNNNNLNDNRLPRKLSVDDRGEEILERLEVFNSVEVKAPEIDIEDDYLRFDRRNVKPTSEASMSFGSIPGDRTFCVSPSSMAFAFCVLGLIFLLAVFVTAWSLLKARRSGSNVSYYTRSLFSSSGGSGYGGSKLLLQDSPCLSHSRNMSSYGRMF